MIAPGARERLAVVGLLLALAGLQACGQTGPLQLPERNPPVTATADQDQDEDREDNER